MMDPDAVEDMITAACKRQAEPFDVSGIDRISRCPVSACLPGGHSQPRHYYHGMVKAVSAALIAGEPEYAAALAASYDLSFSEREAVIDIAHRCKYKLPTGAIGPGDLSYGFDGNVQLYNASGIDGGTAPGLAICNVDVIWTEPGVLQLTRHGAEVPSGSVALVGELQLDADASYRPPQYNAPLVAAALFTAKWLQTDAVIPAVIVLGPGDAVIHRGRPIAVHDLAAYELQLRQVVARVEQARLQVEHSRMLHFASGPYCLTCPSSWCCPSYTNQLRALLDADHNWEDFSPAELSKEDAQRLVGLLELSESLTAKTRQALKHHVDRHGNIDLGDGNTWGKANKHYTYTDARIAFDELVKLTGKDLAWRQLQLPMSNMRAALSEAKRAGKLTYSVKDAMDMTLWRISDKGGLRKARSEKYQRQYEKVQEAPGIEAPPEEAESERTSSEEDPTTR